MPNAYLGPYELLEELGKGGMATVYRAYQPTMERAVAVKVLHPNLLDAAGRQRFQREAKLIARLEHPYIIPLYDFDSAHEPPYLVMRYVGGGTLKDAQTQGTLPLPTVLRILSHIAQALDYAHRQQIIHRDIKPSNIIVDGEGNGFLTDFGLARLTSDQALTASGAVLGTPAYIAPEQVAEAALGPAADLYGLAVVAFELLTGGLPFQAETSMGLLFKHLQEAPPRPTDRNPNLPPAIDGILLQALAKEPALRPASAENFIHTLTQALGLSKLQNPLTPSLTPELPTSTEQNKVVVVLFADAANYAALLGEGQATAVVQRQMQLWWDKAKAVVSAHAGQVTYLADNALVAVWGAVASREEDAANAVHTALELHAHLSPANAAADSLPLQVGIHTGLARILHHAPTQTLTASGEPVTVAQRLAEEAEGTVRVSPDIFREIYGLFDLEPDAPLKMRGKKDKMETYRVTAAKVRSLRTDQPHNFLGVDTRLVGRATELKILQKAYLLAFEDNETQMLTVLGEAGLGKSRLLEEFNQWRELRPEKIRIFHGRATPAMTQRPYALLRDMLSFRFEVLEDDPSATVLQKLEAGVTALLRHTDRETAHLLGYLSGFEVTTSPHVQGLIGDTKQLIARALQLFFRFFARLGQIQPAIITLEDLHHADDASLELFAQLPLIQPALPLLIVGLARPTLLERRPQWGVGQRAHKQVVLTPLDKLDSRELVSEVLQKMPVVPKTLRDLLVERAEGNPLFLEELVKMLLEERVILVETFANAPTPEVATHWRLEEGRLGALRIPTSLRGVLQVRLDTLLYQEKLVLQRAAVIGRVFADVLLEVLDQSEAWRVSDLAACLRVLETRGFIQPRVTASFAGAKEYAFVQALVRDIVYDTLLEQQRISYHATLARWFAATERAEEYLPLIADHYERAGELAAAATTLEQAGDKALSLSAYTDAQSCYDRALSLQTPTATLGFKRAEAYYRLSDFPTAQTILTEALRLATTDLERAAGLGLLGEMQSETGNYAGARVTLEEAVPLARQAAGAADASGQEVLARALYALGDVHWRQGDLTAARACLEESLARARALNDPTRILFALNRLGWVYLWLDINIAEKLLTETHTLATSVGHRERAMIALHNLGTVAEKRGDLRAMLGHYRQALVLAREIKAQQYIAIFLINLANGDIELGNLAAARVGLHEGLTLAYQLGAMPWAVAAVGIFGRLAYAEGDTPRALALIGVAHHHPAFSSEHQRVMDSILPQWGLDAATLAAGLAAGAALDFDEVVADLLRENEPGEKTQEIKE